MLRKLSIIFMIAVLLVGCASVNIAKIQKMPKAYEDKTVSISGKVVETMGVPFLQKGFYQIDDGTGKIWVASTKRSPVRGEQVKVIGEVKAGFTVGGKTYGVVLVEQE